MKRLAVSVLALVASVHGQPAATAETQPAVVALPVEKIGPDDLVSVAVSDIPQLSRTFRVGPDGTLKLPLLKTRITATGKVPLELEKDIAQALADEQILVQPVVTVSVSEYRSRPVSVVGAVKRPATFQALGYVTLLDALTKAEGLSPEAGHEILVSAVRRDDEQSRPDVRRIPVKELLDGTDPALNIRLYGGEEIRVPEAGRVYVVGNVRKPGAFAVSDGAETTVLKLLALSEGLLPYACKQAFIYRQAPGVPGKIEIPVELSRITSRKSPDVQLEAKDILYIPDSKSKRATITTLERLAGFGATTASGLLIWRGR